MKYKNIHFLYHPQKEPAESFAQGLIAELGQSPLENADLIVTVGGDGLLLQALRLAGDKAVYAITPANTGSRGFWTDHDVDSAKKLLENIERAETITLAPLEAEITFTNGNKVIKHAFNDVAIERASGQSALINLKAQFDKASIGPYRIMGDGFVFSTALGSTGTARAYNGPAVDIHNKVIVLVGKGIYEPRGMVPMVAEAEKTSFHIDFSSVEHKRPVRIDFDGHSIETDSDGSRIRTLDISTAEEKAVKMLVTKDPGMRAFSSMMPASP